MGEVVASSELVLALDETTVDTAAVASGAPAGLDSDGMPPTSVAQG